MNNFLDLSSLGTNRIFVMGELCGDYYDMIGILYDQKFTHQDTLVLSGNFIDMEKSYSLDLLYFLESNLNTYTIKGKREVDLLSCNDLPIWIQPDLELLNFIGELPLITKISHNTYVVSSGVQPGVSLQDQDPEVFYSIKEYDKDSRFYQFENPEEKSWYNFEYYEDGDKINFIFGGDSPISGIQVPAGYYIGRSTNSNIKCIILDKRHDDYIMIEG